MKLRKLLFPILTMAAILAFTACGSSSPDAVISEVSEASTAKSSSSSASGTSEEKSEEKPEEKTEPVSETSTDTSAESSSASEESSQTESSVELQAGKYNLVGMTQDGETIATRDLVAMEDMGFIMYLDLKEDGTGILCLYGEEAEVTWNEEVISSNGEDLAYSWDGRYLVLAEDETSITFSTMTAQEVIDAGEGVEGTMSFFEDADGEGADLSTEPTVAVDFAGADWAKDYDGNDLVVIWFDVTNISDDYIYASWDAYTTATQDGEELTEGYIDEGVIPETENLYRSLRPGVRLRCAHVFEADREGGMIEYKVTSGFDDTEVLAGELDPASLVGRPVNEYVLAPIDQIDWLEGAVESGVYGDSAEVTIKDHEIIDGTNGKLLRVWFSYKNIGEEAASFFTAVTVRAVQDGISLSNGYTAYDDADAELQDQEVEPGESLDVCLDYELISNSPVAVELVTYGEGEFIAKAFEVK